MSSRSSTTLWIFIAVIGMGVLQWATRSHEIRLPPGPQRGDITLAQDVLDSEIDGWKQVSFTPANEPEQLPDGQFWWTSSWRYQKDDLTALVSFDQADWGRWHDLTICYRAIGWDLVGRTVSSPGNANDSYAITTAQLARQRENQFATLMFTNFDQDGGLLPARELSLSPGNRDVSQTLSEKVGNRLGDSKTLKRPGKVLQVQVLLTHPRGISDDEFRSLMTLHIQSLESFRTEWLRQKNFRSKQSKSIDSSSTRH